MTLATFCERVLEEKDGVLTLVRVIDQFAITAHGPEVPDELPSGGILELTLVVSLKSGSARGRHELAIRAEQPSGQHLGEQKFDLHFNGDDHGVNAVLPIAVPAIEGVYWFDILINGKRISRVPFRFLYSRAVRS